MSIEIGIKEIMDLIPHRYPFLLIDKIVDFKENKSITAIKNVTINEPFFQGHFPNNPVMPGVLQIEAIAQAAAILVSKSLAAAPGTKGVLFTGIGGVKFRKQVIPGDTIEFKVEIIKSKLSVYYCKGEGFVSGKKVIEVGEFSAMIYDV